MFLAFCALWTIFLSKSKLWTGRRSIMFMRQWRMYSNSHELSDDVEKLRRCYSKYSQWAIISAIALLPVLLCNSLEVLFGGESARIMMVWTDEVAFYIFFIPKCIFALIFIFALFVYAYYKDKLRALVNDTNKCKVTLTDISDFIWSLLAIFIRLLVFL